MLGSAVEKMNMGQIFGSKTTRQGTSSRQANRYMDTSACPAGQEVVRHGSIPISPKYVGGPRSQPFVDCKAIPPPQAAPPPPPPQINVQTVVSPTLQTDISPQISPTFQQVQDSPGSVQGATATQSKPGGMRAEGGGAGRDSTAILDFLRMQSESEARRRSEDAAARERERQDRIARDEQDTQYRRQQDEQRTAEGDAQRQRDQQAQSRQEQLRQAQNLELQRLDSERQAAEAAGRTEQAAQLQAQYEAQRREWEKTSAQPGAFVSTPGAVTRQAPSSGAPSAVGEPEKPGIPLPVIVGAVALVLVGGYFYTTKKGSISK